MMRLRHFAVALSIAATAISGGILAASPAAASVSTPVTWNSLLLESTSVAVATPTASESVWENGRIYTYTHIRIDRRFAGSLTEGDDAWVRTLGGVVGKIGQTVEGEAILAPGQPSLLFLHAGPTSSYEVTARGQGQFPVVTDKDPTRPRRVVRNGAVGLLMKSRTDPQASPPILAGDFLHGRTLDDAAREVDSAWGRMHAQ